MQGAEAGRQNAIRDLQSYGIDPSSGRYAALDKASQVMAGAQAAGAGNHAARCRTEVTGVGMQNQAMGLSKQNVQTGYGASRAMNALLGTAMQLKYSPLGQTSSRSHSRPTQSENYSLGYSGACAAVAAALPLRAGRGVISALAAASAFTMYFRCVWTWHGCGGGTNPG